MLSALFFLSYLLTTASAATPSQWRSRSIYQVLTDRFARTDGSTTAPCPAGFAGYCGGTWAGLAQHLDYIQGMGFDAIWISPVVAQIDDASRAYHGYSARDAYSLNPNFGTAADLKALSAALHARGMYLMVDVVVNHFGWAGTAASTDYSTLSPFNESRFFHPVCWITDYTNQTNVEACWLGTEQYPLPDVDTSQSSVRSTWQSWIRWLVAEYSIDGLRIDTVKHVEPSFWPGFNAAAGVYCMGEVADGDVGYVCPYQAVLDGVLAYPTYYQATQFFSNTTTTSQNLVGELTALDAQCRDATLLGSFAENHDQPRFASLTGDVVLARNILAFTVLADGIPVVYQGLEQRFSGGADPFDREAVWLAGYDTGAELYGFVGRVNAIRKFASVNSEGYLTGHSRVV